MKKVLIAEDDIALRKVLKKAISKKYQVFEAVNGTSVLEIVRGVKPDLILLDLMMPEKSGFDVLAALKIEDNIKIPIIVLSNLDEDKDRMRAKNLTADYYLVKSNVSMEEIVLTIDRFIMPRTQDATS